MKTRARLDPGTTAVNTVPQYTYVEVLRELETLGVVFENDETTVAMKNISSLVTVTTPFAVKMVAMHDHEMTHRIMTAIRLTDEPARIIWRNTLGRINSRDMTRSGKNIVVTELARIMPQFERLLAVNPIDAAIMDAGKYRDISLAFQNLLRASYIENHTGINPGDANYNLIQANLIHLNITRPKKYGTDEVQPYLQTNHDDIAYIAQHIDETLRLLPELYARKLASADAIETLLNVKPVLAEGAL
jgi:hypothetical protein